MVDAVDVNSSSSPSVVGAPCPGSPSEAGLLLRPVGIISSWFKARNGTPRQGAVCPESKGVLCLNKDFFNNPHHALDGILSYSHVWLIFHFHKNTNKKCMAKVHPPRFDGKAIGIFSTRSPHRPNPLGLTLAKIERLDGDKLYLSGIDILDGTPIYDIKPYMDKYDCPAKLVAGDPDANLAPQTNAISASVVEPVTEVNDLIVDFTAQSLASLQKFHKSTDHGEPKCDYCLTFLNNWQESQRAIASLLRADPRSVYRRNKCTDRLYYFSLDRIHITCWFDSETNSAQVVKVKVQPGIDQNQQGNHD